MKRPTHKKNTLLKDAQTNAEDYFFKLLFFSANKENFFSTLPFLIKLFSPTHWLIAKMATCASYVNRLGQNLCGLQAVVRGENSLASAKTTLKGFLKRGTLSMNRTMVHIANSCCYTNSRASNPPFLKTALVPSIVPDIRWESAILRLNTRNEPLKLKYES